MSNLFKPAVRKQVKLKLAITGPSGSGKTYSALRMAKGLGEKIAVLDTENSSACLYEGLPEMPRYDVLDFAPPYTSTRYQNAIQMAVKAGYEVLIIDSISHQWSGEGGILDRKEKEAQAKPGTNSYTLWAKYTPEHEEFKTAILQSPIHIIATMRSKTAYVMEDNGKGKQAPKKVGLEAVQRDGFEYEFTTILDLSMDHIASASKDRTGLFDKKFFVPSEETGKQLSKWLQGSSASDNHHATVTASGQETVGAKTDLPKSENVPTDSFVAKYKMNPPPSTASSPLPKVSTYVERTAGND